MALVPPAFLEILLASRLVAVNGFAGAAYDQLCLGVANGVCAWAVGQPDNVALEGLAIGAAGVGAVIPVGSIFTVPPAVPVMMDALVGAGMLGPLAASLATSMTAGISDAFSTLAWYVGISSAVGVGADVSKVTVANAATLIAMLETTLPAAGVVGAGLHQMTIGLGVGIAGLVALGEGSAPVVGVPIIPPAPSTGPTNSVLL
jgi:hypothetical protein